MTRTHGVLLSRRRTGIVHGRGRMKQQRRSEPRLVEHLSLTADGYLSLDSKTGGSDVGRVILKDNLPSRYSFSIIFSIFVFLYLFLYFSSVAERQRVCEFSRNFQRKLSSFSKIWEIRDREPRFGIVLCRSPTRPGSNEEPRVRSSPPERWREPAEAPTCVVHCIVLLNLPL